MLDEGYLLYNIQCEVGDEMSTLFLCDSWLGGASLEVRFRRLFELDENKLAIVVDMHFMG
jgi:hypothetical protein